MITNKQRNQAYKDAPEHVRALYSGDDAGTMLRQIFETFRLDERQYPEFIHVYGDVVLGYHRISDFQSLLQARMKVDSATAGALAVILKQRLVENGFQEATAVESAPISKPPQEQMVGYANSPAAHTIPQPPVVPQYQKPLTNAPRYGENPPQQ